MHPGSIPGEASIFALTLMASVCSCGSTGGKRISRGDGPTGTMNAEYSELRTKMVDGQIRTTDVTNRHAPGDGVRSTRSVRRRPASPLAYIDENLEISPARAGRPARFLLEPSPFAKLLQLAEIQPGDAVLDIGCGTGYSAAVISKLAASVIALESDPVLAERATATLVELGYDDITIVTGPLPGGHPANAPYDVIFVGGAVDELPQSIFDQLKEGGRLVTVEGRGNAGVARVYLKDNSIVTGRRAFNAAIPQLPGFEKPHTFEF